MKDTYINIIENSSFDPQIKDVLKTLSNNASDDTILVLCGILLKFKEMEVKALAFDELKKMRLDSNAKIQEIIETALEIKDSPKGGFPLTTPNPKKEV